ncbi:DUF4282 domain-containing protein [Parvularcula dongshanensis]|uniref:DUF4282 domain-containing protein n=1 Tax=Parvularcula dongshanensis TaxID=1173995 RepID=A0A840I1H8_9PROT|nr:DUF4282 domain-containing protein [Parvularcula dongshanensis]MBB4658048.1 hypothetical protein [Parvularcula dongshanensis]
MSDIIGRFLTFEETLGRGLVKFAYFVLLIVGAIGTIVTMIGGVVLMFEDFGAGFWQFIAAPFWFLIAVILLRIGAEVVNAVLSIDDNLTHGARIDGRMPARLPGVSESGTRAGVTPPPPASAATASSSSAAHAATGAPNEVVSPAKKATKKRTKKKAAKKTAPSGPASSSSDATRETVDAANASAGSARADASGATEASSRNGTPAGESTARPATDEPKTD